MITVLLGSVSALFVIIAFVVGLLIGMRMQAKADTQEASMSICTADLSPEEAALQEKALQRLKEDNEAFTRMMGYNQSMAYKMGDHPFAGKGGG